MKTKHLFLPILTGVLCAAAAHANEDITITGSTACRRIMYDRAATLFDPGFTTQGGALAFNNTANQITASGTMSNAIPSLGATPVTLRFAMSGANQGAQDLYNSNPLATKDPVTGFNSNQIPSLAFFDQFPEASVPSIPSSGLTANSNLLVLPFVFFKNPGGPGGMTGVTNITKEQTIMLMNSSGVIAGFDSMKPDFLGGTTNGGPVYFLGRDAGSGTRIEVLKCVGFTGIPRQYATNSLGALVNSTLTSGSNGVAVGGNGYSSGGTLCKVVAGITANNCIGYAGESDASSGNGITTGEWLSYEGIFPTHDAVANGRYPIWGYEHLLARAGSLSANQAAIKDAFVAAMTNPGYQATNNTVFRPNAVALGEMKVKRGVDGGSFTTTPVAGF